MKIWAWVLVAGMLGAVVTDAEAQRRLGGGKSMGRQSSNVAQREAAPPPTAPAQQSAAAQPKPQPQPAAPAAAAPKRPWGAMLGGLAAGLGLAWLAHSLGLGSAFGSVLMVLLFAMLALMAFAWFMRNRRASAPAAQPAPFAFQGASPLPLSNQKPYRPENVGNDASARPWERSSMAFEVSQTPPAAPGGGSMIGSALLGKQTWGVPAGFDTEGFLRSAKANFVTLQAAWDRSDIAALRAMMTDGMLAEIRTQLAEREAHTGGSGNQTEVVFIEARLLGIEELDAEYMASVEFSGMIKEDASAGPGPFREVWNMTRSKGGNDGWLVAGVQALQ